MNRRGKIRQHNRAEPKRFTPAILALALATLAVPRVAAGQACVGDCDADLVVGIDDLISGVRIALGDGELARCAVLDTDRSSIVDVDELLAAVNASLVGCPNTIRVHGTCSRPGPEGLEPCPAGTIVTAARCGLRRTCLSDPASPIALGSARVAPGGTFTLIFDREEVGASILVFDARLEAGDEGGYRSVSFELRTSTGGRPGMRRIEVTIDPSSEAAARLLEETGFELFDDAGSEAVLAAVRAATSATDFSGLSVAEAAQLATSMARADANVILTIEGGATPTATRTPTRTATPTATPAPPGRCNPGPQPTYPTVSGATMRIGSAAGVAGATVCVGVTLQTAMMPIAGFQLEIDFVPEAPVIPNGERAACAIAPALGFGAGYPFRPVGCTPGVDCRSVFVLAFINGGPLRDNSLAVTCEIGIPSEAPLGDYPLGCSDGMASDGAGNPIDLGCVAGTVSVVDTPGM